MKQFQYFFFDLDGTLTDPGEGITNSVAYALQKFGITVSNPTTLYPFIGPPLISSFQKYYQMSEEQARQAVTYYREYFSHKGLFENIPYPGIAEQLAALKASGKTLAVATSKPQPFAEEILAHFDLKKYFTIVAGASMDETRTEKWEVIEYALSRLPEAGRDTVLMIGDREHDILGAKKAGLCSAGVLWGYGDRKELDEASADYILSHISELSAWASKSRG